MISRFIPIAIAVTLLAAAPAAAQDQSMANMPGMAGMGSMMGTHMMPATVTAVDSKTGLIDVSAGSMALKLHFPPATLAAVKPGDKITLHLAFSKP